MNGSDFQMTSRLVYWSIDPKSSTNSQTHGKVDICAALSTLERTQLGDNIFERVIQVIAKRTED